MARIESSTDPLVVGAYELRPSGARGRFLFGCRRSGKLLKGRKHSPPYIAGTVGAGITPRELSDRWAREMLEAGRAVRVVCHAPEYARERAILSSAKVARRERAAARRAKVARLEGERRAQAERNAAASLEGTAAGRAALEAERFEGRDRLESAAATDRGTVVAEVWPVTFGQGRGER